MVMDVVLVAVLGVLGGLVVSAVIFAFIARRRPVGASTDLDEMAVELERVSKAVRRLTMQRVRQAAQDSPEPPPEFQPAQPAPVLTGKDALRARVFGGSR